MKNKMLTELANKILPKMQKETGVTYRVVALRGWVKDHIARFEITLTDQHPTKGEVTYSKTCELPASQTRRSAATLATQLHRWIAETKTAK